MPDATGPRSPRVRHHRAQDAHHRALAVVHAEVERPGLPAGLLRAAGQPFQHPGRYVGVGAAGAALFDLLAERHHRRPDEAGEQTLRYGT
ncbi:hypothetical protein GCM10023176_37550 [Micromonospora coerulea]|uniref:Uncharacterized protein n=1 Tax=Micromonospora coerulea TaxID=47856 RepID=A0ABP8SRE0_9ACTN